ncbi:hypothetical protein BGZ58_008362 [Dissophora ornata]|nr:hypothetical protein BGZ58_008362 [Dissophora ornata]
MADVIEVIGGKESDSSSTSSIIPERTLGLAEMTPLSTGEKQEVNEDDGTEDESGEEDDDDDDDGEEKEDEEPTQEVLEWRAKVEGMHSPNEPLVFDVKTGFSCVLPMNDMDIGYFEIVVCVSLNDINLESIKSIVIDTNEITKDLIFYDGDFARLRIHRPAEHSQKDRSQFMGISFITEAGCPKSSFEVHYIELQYCQFRSIVEDKDHIIYGEGRPDQIISVGPDDVPKLPVEVSAFEISDTGEYAVTLYFDKDLAYVDLWDLRLLDNKDTSDQQQQATKPHVFNKAFASATIEVSKIFQERENNSRSLNHSACISSYGKQVSIFIVREDDEDPGLFCVLKANPTAPADKDLSQPWTLEQTKTACKSKRCVLMAYHRTDLNNTDEDAERFYTSDGMNIAVYNTKGSWSLLYALNFQKELDIQTFQDVFFSMKRRYFAWTGSRGAISIWDFETGKLISHIYTGDDKNAAYPVLSPDGSKVALCVRNKVEIRDTMTGIKLGVLKKGVGKENYLEIVFGEEHFLMFNVDASTVSRTVQHNMRSVVRVHDMSIVRTFYMHEDYEFHRPQICHDNVFTYMRGPNVNILRPGPILDPVVVKDKCVGFDNCKRRAIEVIPVFDDSEDKFINTAGTKFLLTSSIESSLGEYIQVFRVREDNNETNPRSMAIPVGLNVFEYSMFFIPETSQLGIVANGCLLLWTLSSDPNVPFCRLKSIWRFQKVPEGAKPDDVCLRDMTSVDSCEHGRNLKIKLSRLQLYRYVSDVVEAVAGATQDTLTVPISPEDTLSATEEYRLNQGFVGLIGVYALGNEECKKTIIRYLKGHIRENRENSAVSPINSICGAWTRDRRPFIESILSQLLPSDRITWVPGTYSSKEDNPLCMILRTAETDASALGVTRIIMDYCVNHANRSRNLAFLSTFFGALHQCMEIYPDEAFERLGRIAYVPVMHRPYILTHSTIARSPQFRLQFWKPSSKSLCTMDDPVLQLDVPATDPDPDNDKFTRPIFMASFDALWYYTDDKKIKGSNSDLLADAAAAYTTTWWKTLYHMIRLKCRLHIHNYVETYDFTIEFYDNPAIAALVAYKWNTIGYWYWFVRFFFQCCFYALVIIASIMQVYYSQPSQLLGLFVAIIVMAVVFIWLELLQAVRSVNRYTK